MTAVSSVISVSDLNERVKTVLGADRSLNDIWVSGEISNLTKHTSGHCYFTLKDQKSEVRCTLFRGARNSLAFEPAESMKVTAFGSVDMYVVKGTYQFNVSTMRKSGIGEMYLALEELKKKLNAEGLFDTSRKRSLPRYPVTLGIVTSPTGAVIHDILKAASRRFPVDVLFAPVLVQGDGAAASIAKGIELMNTQNVDVIIVGRGGGSSEDMWAFNEEIVARAIASSGSPIISAVGHEVDVTIADLVADVRASTPSAAAEIALPDISSEMKNIENKMIRASGSLISCMSAMNNSFKISDSKLSVKRAKEKVDENINRLNELSGRSLMSVRSSFSDKNGVFRIIDAKLSPKRAEDAVNQYIMKIDDLSETADSSLLRNVSSKRKDIGSAEQRMNAIDPMKVLERGYGFVEGPDGKALVSTSQISDGSNIEIRMRDGKVKAKVNEVIRK